MVLTQQVLIEQVRETAYGVSIPLWFLRNIALPSFLYFS